MFDDQVGDFPLEPRVEPSPGEPDYAPEPTEGELWRAAQARHEAEEAGE